MSPAGSLLIVPIEAGVCSNEPMHACHLKCARLYFSKGMTARPIRGIHRCRVLSRQVDPDGR